MFGMFFGVDCVMFVLDGDEFLGIEIGFYGFEFCECI